MPAGFSLRFIPFLFRRLLQSDFFEFFLGQFLLRLFFTGSFARLLPFRLFTLPRLLHRLPRLSALSRLLHCLSGLSVLAGLLHGLACRLYVPLFLDCLPLLRLLSRLLHRLPGLSVLPRLFHSVPSRSYFPGGGYRAFFLLLNPRTFDRAVR